MYFSFFMVKTIFSTISVIFLNCLFERKCFCVFPKLFGLSSEAIKFHNAAASGFFASARRLKKEVGGKLKKKTNTKPIKHFGGNDPKQRRIVVPAGINSPRALCCFVFSSSDIICQDFKI